MDSSPLPSNVPELCFDAIATARLLLENVLNKAPSITADEEM